MKCDGKGCDNPGCKKCNNRRAAMAKKALKVYRYEVEKEDALTDLLVDLMHLCKAQGHDFERLLVRAQDHYEAEK